MKPIKKYKNCKAILNKKFNTEIKKAARLRWINRRATRLETETAKEKRGDGAGYSNCIIEHMFESVNAKSRKIEDLTQRQKICIVSLF